MSIGRGEEEGKRNFDGGARQPPDPRQFEVLKKVVSTGYTSVNRAPQEMLFVVPRAVWGPWLWRERPTHLRRWKRWCPRSAAWSPRPRIATGTVQMDARTKAKMQGYEGDPCGDCGNYTLVRNGTCMKCNTCGGTSGCS